VVYRIPLWCILAVAGGCHERPIPVLGVAAGADARALGVRGYDVLGADERALDLRVLSDPPRMLAIRVASGETAQRLDGPDGMVLRTSRTRISAATEASGTPLFAAERIDEAWTIGEKPEAPAARALRLVLSVDVDMAVQGSGIVFGGAELVQCTVECHRASECAANLAESGCPGHVVRCGACLEREP
jgi:hypothetical protein